MEMNTYGGSFINDVDKILAFFDYLPWRKHHFTVWVADIEQTSQPNISA